MDDTHDRQLNYFPDSNYDLVVFGSSAGGINALISIFAALPSLFPCAIAVVQHLYPSYPSQLAPILRRSTGLNVKQAEDSDILEASTIYIAPPDNHLLIGKNKRLLLTQTAAVQYVRPSANLLFSSAAQVFKARVLAVVLTGMGSDGADGVRLIKAVGGLVIAQDEATSKYFSMPDSAIKTGAVDLILPLSEIAGTVMRLVSRDSS
jgi:two-component system, chemotaxis family, protein-glutamate methylesterase/glutaminase